MPAYCFLFRMHGIRYKNLSCEQNNNRTKLEKNRGKQGKKNFFIALTRRVASKEGLMLRSAN